MNNNTKGFNPNTITKLTNGAEVQENQSTEKQEVQLKRGCTQAKAMTVTIPMSQYNALVVRINEFIDSGDEIRNISAYIRHLLKQDGIK